MRRWDSSAVVLEDGEQLTDLAHLGRMVVPTRNLGHEDTVKATQNGSALGSVPLVAITQGRTPMTKRTPWLAGLLLFLTFVALAQKERKTAGELKALGKEAIIEIAEKEIQEDFPEFSKENYDYVKVLVDEHSVYVSFVMPILYVPRNSTAYYGLLWGLEDPNGPTASFETESNPRNAFGAVERQFFQPTEESAQAIAFVLKAIGVKAEDIPYRETLTIHEHESTYEVSFDSPGAGSLYTIAKETGEILERMDSHYYPPPGDEGNRLEEFAD